MEYVTEVQRAGRITIPVILRNELGIAEGSKLIIRQENNELKLLTQQQSIEEARQLLRQYLPQGIGSVDDFLAEKRKEVAAEEEKYRLKGNS